MIKIRKKMKMRDDRRETRQPKRREVKGREKRKGAEKIEEEREN